MANYAVKLTFESPQREKFRGRDIFRLRVTASDAVDMPNEIFLARHLLVDPDNADAETKVEFQAICSVYDLSIYPANTPDVDQSPPFFRVAQIDIPLPGITAYDETVEEIKKQVDFLVSQQQKLDNLEVQEVYWVPSEPTTTTTTPAP